MGTFQAAPEQALGVSGRAMNSGSVVIAFDQRARADIEPDGKPARILKIERAGTWAFFDQQL